MFPSFQVIEQVLYGRTRPHEHGDTALNPWVFLYDLIFHCYVRQCGCGREQQHRDPQQAREYLITNTRVVQRFASEATG